MNVENIIKLLKENGYCITAKINKNVIMLEIPEKNIFPFTERAIIRYKILKNKIRIDTYINNEIKETKEIEIEQYAIRPYIINHIIKTCLLMNYNFAIIRWVDNNDNEITGGEFFSKMPPPDEDTLKESMLSIVLSDCIINGFTEKEEKFAEEQEILDGYNKVKELFQSANLHTGINNGVV